MNLAPESRRARWSRQLNIHPRLAAHKIIGIQSPERFQIRRPVDFKIKLCLLAHSQSPTHSQIDPVAGNARAFERELRSVHHDGQWRLNRHLSSRDFE